jgi:hypothetical protein
MKKNIQVLIIILLSMMTVIVFYDFIKIGFSNSDDSDKYVRTLVGNFLADANSWAKAQGRFFFLYRVILASIPYMVDNILWLKSFQYLPIILNFIFFSIIIAKILKSEKFGYAIYLLLILFFSVPKDPFMLPIAYPFLFSTDFLLFLLSALFLIKYFEYNKYRYYLLSLLFFTIPFYSFEAYFIFFCFYFYVLISNNHSNFKLNDFLKPSFLKEILPLLLIVSTFYVVYFSFRTNLNHDKFYTGSSFANDFNLSYFFTFLFNINKSAFPTYIYYQSTEIFKTYDVNHKNSLFYILSNSSIVAVLKSITLSSLFAWILLQIPENYSFKKILKVLFIAIILSYGLNIILGLSEKYNQNLAIDGYLTTYFAFFGITFSIFCLILLFLKLLSGNIIYKYLFITAIFMILFSVSIKISYTNNYLSKDWSISQKRFLLIDNIIENKGFDEIPENSIILSADLNETKSILGKRVTGNSFNWKIYINTKIGKTIYFCKNMTDFEGSIKTYNNAEIYILNKYEYPEKDLYLITISKIDRQSFLNGETIASELDIYFYDTPLLHWTYNLILNNNLINFYANNGAFLTETKSKDFVINNKKINSRLNKVSLKGEKIAPKSFYINFEE